LYSLIPLYKTGYAGLVFMSCSKIIPMLNKYYMFCEPAIIIDDKKILTVTEIINKLFIVD